MTGSDFPSGWIEQLAPLLGGELPDFLRAYDDAPLRGLRTRPGLPKPEDALAPVPWAENGWYLPLGSQAGSWAEHEAGAYYIQEPSAMAPAAALRPEKGDRVLDLCAAPGGKSTQLAAYLGGTGLLVCNEPVPGRAQILSRNMERMGVTNAVVTCALPEDLSPRWAGYFDKILVDAPCSGEGMFRRHPETRAEWTASAPAGCAQRQRHILDHAARMLRPGGKICYSTCTFNAQENEGVIQGFLEAHPEFSLVPFALPGLPSCDGTLRLWPHRVKGEGHFTALLQKAEDEAAFSLSGDGPLIPLSKGEGQMAAAFLKEHLSKMPEISGVFAGHLVSVPGNMPPLRGIKVLRLGLQLGEIKGKIFAPDHALALACRAIRVYEVTREEAAQYQAGQVLPVPDELRGYYALSLKGLQLGWGKASGGQMKNHYPKGLRRP